jgi:FkbM family methyltransferase
MSKLNTLLKDALYDMGIVVSRVKPYNIFNHLKITTIFDVGANIGQYRNFLRKIGYKNKIVSIEPMSKEHRLISEASKTDKNWIVAPRCGLGDSNKKESINISENSYSSSILNMLSKHELAAPNSKYIDSEQIDIKTFNDIFDRYKTPGGIYFLKIDTQGYELEVLKGASVALNSISAVKIELSIVELYENSETYEFYLNYFRDLGYELWDIEPGFRNFNTSQMLQFDAIFVNKKIVSHS